MTLAIVVVFTVIAPLMVLSSILRIRARVDEEHTNRKRQTLRRNIGNILS